MAHGTQILGCGNATKKQINELQEEGKQILWLGIVHERIQRRQNWVLNDEASVGESKPDDAFKHIVGYSCYNECTIRDWQEHTSQFTMGKNFEKTGSFGPWMTLAEDIPDYTKLTIETRLNGKTMQKAKLSQLIFNIPNLISYISKAMPWKAGDVLVTGTPGGVGFKRKPPIYLKDGDDVEVEISNIGILLNKVKNEKN